jgi:hypothetical protein
LANCSARTSAAASRRTFVTRPNAAGTASQAATLMKSTQPPSPAMPPSPMAMTLAASKTATLNRVRRTGHCAASP